MDSRRISKRISSAVTGRGSGAVDGGGGAGGIGDLSGNESSSGLGSGFVQSGDLKEGICERSVRGSRFSIGNRTAPIFSSRSSESPQSLANLDSLQFRMLKEKCETMEKKCNQKLNEQKLKYDQMFDELSSDLELLTTQLMTVPQQTQDMYQEGRNFEDSIKDLENQNDLLQEAIQSYERQLLDAENEMKIISVELEQMRRELSDLRFEVQTKDASVEELRREKLESEEKLDLQKKLCKCHESKENSKDIMSIQLQEMHHLLSQKSAETVRNSVAIRWKNLEISRMQQLSDEEKKRLNEELTSLTKNLSEMTTKVMYMQKMVDKKEAELIKLHQRLMDGSRKESELHEELLRKTEQLTSAEKEQLKFKSTVEELSGELDKSRMDGRERETQYMNDLTRTREVADKLNARLIKAEDTLRHKSMDNETYVSQNDVLLKECKKLKEDNFRLRSELATLEGRCESLNDLLKNNKFEMNAIQQEINRLSTLDSEVSEIRENNRIFIRQNRDVLTNYQELLKQHGLFKEQFKVLQESKEQLQLSLETSKIWQKEYQEREKVTNATLVKQNEHIKSLLDERKTLIGKVNDMQNDLIITTNTLDQYREKLGTTTSEYVEYDESVNMYEAGSYEAGNQQAQMLRYSSDPQLNQSETGLTYLTKVQEIAKKMYRTCRDWPEMMKRQLADDMFSFH